VIKTVEKPHFGASLLNRLISMNILTTKNLSCTYKRRQALKNINLQVPKGVVAGLIGHNGSGKSTLFKAILNELEPTSGIINSYAKRKGFLIENGSYYGHLTAFQNLKFNHYAFDTKLDKLLEILSIVGLHESKDTKVSEFSLGMKKRLSIAMSFVSNPDLVLLDEPTNELDPDGVLLLNQIIKKWNEDHGTTILYSSHLLSEVVKTCNYIFLLKDGELVYQGYRSDLEEEVSLSLEGQTLDNIYNSLK